MLCYTNHSKYFIDSEVLAYANKQSENDLHNTDGSYEDKKNNLKASKQTWEQKMIKLYLHRRAMCGKVSATSTKSLSVGLGRTLI